MLLAYEKLPTTNIIVIRLLICRQMQSDSREALAFVHTIPLQPRYEQKSKVAAWSISIDDPSTSSYWEVLLGFRICISTMLDQGWVDCRATLRMLLRTHVSDVLMHVVDPAASEDEKQRSFWTDKERHGRVSER